MIQKLRNPYWMKWGLWVVLGLTIPAFVLFYGFGDVGGPSPGMQAGSLLTVHTDRGRVEFGPRELDGARREAASYYTNVYAAYTGIPAFQLRQIQDQLRGAMRPPDVVDFAVAQVALQDRLDRQGVRVTDGQVRQYLREAGITRQELEGILRANRMTEHEYASIIRRQLRTDMAAQTVQRVARTSLLELWQEYLLAREKLTFDYVRLPVRVDGEMELDEEELQARYDRMVEERDSSVIERQKYVYDYVKIDVPRASPEEPTEEELREAWEAAPDDDAQLQQEGGIEVRHVLVALGPAMEEEEREAARERAEEARRRIVEDGEDFAEVANEMSEDTRNLDFSDVEIVEGEDPEPRLRGGLLPTKLEGDEIDAWGEDWIRYINEADEGEVSPVIETPQGYSVVKVESRTEAGKRPFDDVRSILRNRMMSERRRAAQDEREERLADARRRLSAAVAAQTTLEGVAGEVDSEVRTTEPILPDRTNIPEIGNLSNEREALRLLISEGDQTGLLQTNDGQPVVMRLAEIRPERVLEFDEVRSTVENTLRREKTREAVLARAETIRERVQEGEDFTAIAEELDLEISSIESSPREDIPERLTAFASLHEDLLRVAQGDVVISRGGVGDFVSEFLVAHIHEVEEPELSEFMADLRAYERDLLNAKRQGYVEDFRRDAAQRLRTDISEQLIPPEPEPRRRSRRDREGDPPAK